MAVKKPPLMHTFKKTRVVRAMSLAKPMVGDGLILGAILGFLIGLAMGIKAEKTGEDLGSFAIMSGVRGSVACALLFGIIFALKNMIYIS